MSFVGHEYNINKGDVEKLLLGDINAPVEFFFDPSSEAVPSMGPPSGLRSVKDASNNFSILEIKYISNYIETIKESDRKYPSMGVSDPDQITDDRRNQIKRGN